MPVALTNNENDATYFEWPVRIYWEDTDAGGIVFYANYLKFFERARTEWLRQLGLGQQTLRDTVGGLFVVTDAQLKYHRSARLDDLLRVTSRTTQQGAASLSLHQQAWLVPPAAEPGAPVGTPTLLCEASIRLGWVDATTHRPRRMPPQVLQALAMSVHAPT